MNFCSTFSRSLWFVSFFHVVLYFCLSWQTTSHLNLLWSSHKHMDAHRCTHTQQICCQRTQEKDPMQNQPFYISSLHLFDSLMMAFCSIRFNFLLSPSSEWCFMKINLQIWNSKCQRAPAHDTYRNCPTEAGSLDGRLGLHGISAFWVKQFAWLLPGLHFTNWYTAVCGAPGERSNVLLLTFQEIIQIQKIQNIF